MQQVIFGDYNPGGRLPYTVPTGLEQLPPFESYQMDRGSCGEAACGRTYRYMDKPPLFHFGSGQSASPTCPASVDSRRRPLSAGAPLCAQATARSPRAR
jgi:beta-glucosidase